MEGLLLASLLGLLYLWNLVRHDPYRSSSPRTWDDGTPRPTLYEPTRSLMADWMKIG